MVHGLDEIEGRLVFLDLTILFGDANCRFLQLEMQIDMKMKSGDGF